MGGRKGHLASREPEIRMKRVYAEPSPTDGTRILVDRLWPRGVSKKAAAIDFWARGVSPSNELRRWYGHDPAKWEEFKKRYSAELDANPEGVEELRAHVGRGGRVTFVFGSKQERLNNAAALLEYLQTRG